MLGPFDLTFDVSRVGGYLRTEAERDEKECINAFFQELNEYPVKNDYVTLHPPDGDGVAEVYLVRACEHIVEIRRGYGDRAIVRSVKRGTIARMDAALWGVP